MTNATELLTRVLLQHAPQRHALMLAPGDLNKKYNDRPGAITPAMLRQHLAGEITLAAPAAAKDKAALLPIDVDAGGLVAIYALLDAAAARGLWGWGEYHHREELPLDQQRGYVWISFDQLLPAVQLQALGKQLIAEADVPDSIRSMLDSRVHNADTRLPFALHTHTNRHGSLMFENHWFDINDNPQAALEFWANAYQCNDSSRVPALPVPSPQEHHTSAPPQQRRSSSATLKSSVTINEIKQRYNETHSLTQIILARGGKRATHSLYHCPCGYHAHGDAHASLLIKPATKPLYGDYVAQGYSPRCKFASGPGQVWDAFNVYAILNGLSFKDMLAHARRELGLELPRFSKLGTNRVEPEKSGTPKGQPEKSASPLTAPSAPRKRPPPPQGDQDLTAPPPPQGDQDLTAPAQKRPIPQKQGDQDLAAIRQAARDHLASAPLSKGQRRVYDYLITTVRKGLTSVQSIQQIGTACDLSERQTRRVLRSLEAEGMIQTSPRTRQTNIYQLLDPRKPQQQTSASPHDQQPEPEQGEAAVIIESDDPAPDPTTQIHNHGQVESVALEPNPDQGVTAAQGGHFEGNQGGHLTPTVKIKQVLKPHESLSLVRGGEKGGDICRSSACLSESSAPSSPPLLTGEGEICPPGSENEPAEQFDSQTGAIWYEGAEICPPGPLLPESSASSSPPLLAGKGDIFSSASEGEAVLQFDPQTGAIWYEGGAMFLQSSRVSFGPPLEEWTYSRSPREIKHSHAYGMARLRAEAAARQAAAATRPSIPDPRPAPPEQLRLDHQAGASMSPAETQKAGEAGKMQALRAQLDLIERAARRSFARKDIAAGIRFRQRAADLKQQLFELEQALLPNKPSSGEGQDQLSTTPPPYKPPAPARRKRGAKKARQESYF